MISLSRAEQGARRFRPRLWPTLAALGGTALLVALGTWQVQRLHWKEGLIAERQAGLAIAPAPLPAQAEDWRAFDFRRVGVAGRFRHDKEQLFGFSAHQGEPGHHLLTPLVRSDGAAVLVDRGWIPADKAHPASRRRGQIEGQVEISGIARFRGDGEESWFRPENRPDEGLWYWYDLPALERALGLPLLPVVVEADATPNPGGLPIGGQTRLDIPNDHLQYAITWFLLALALAGVYLAYHWENGRLTVAGRTKVMPTDAR
jgi:surfeit locus 1 family protein